LDFCEGILEKKQRVQTLCFYRLLFIWTDIYCAQIRDVPIKSKKVISFDLFILHLIYYGISTDRILFILQLGFRS